MTPQPQKPIIKVAILTPYLYDDFADTFNLINQDSPLMKQVTEARLQEEIERCGYEPNNLHGNDYVESEKYHITIETPKNSQRIRERGPHHCQFTIAGSTTDYEKLIKSFKGSGSIIARYSMFYGNASGYTNTTPQETGYALDIPKKVSHAKYLLTCDEFLEAILERDEQKIRWSISKLNQKLAEPILITEYLSEALEINP